MSTVHDKCLVKMEKAFSLWVEDTQMNRKHVLIDGNALHQKAPSLYEVFSKRSPGTSDSEPLTAREGWSHRFSTRAGILSSRHRKKGEYSSTIWYFERENTFTYLFITD